MLLCAIQVLSRFHCGCLLTSTYNNLVNVSRMPWQHQDQAGRGQSCVNRAACVAVQDCGCRIAMRQSTICGVDLASFSSSSLAKAPTLGPSTNGESNFWAAAVGSCPSLPTCAIASARFITFALWCPVEYTACHWHRRQSSGLLLQLAEVL